MDVAGLVSSILTFVDFSWTIVRGTYDVYNSASGATEENVHIGHVLEDLQIVTGKMRREMPGQDDHEKALLELEYQCRGLSSDLADILQKLTTRRRFGLQSLNIMLRSLVKENEVREIEKRLGEYRSQMILRLNLMLLEQTVATQESARLAQESQSDHLRHLIQKTEALHDDNPVLRRLYFDGMYRRAEDITDATDGTFDWLLADTNEAPPAPSQGTSASTGTPEQHRNRVRWADHEPETRHPDSNKLSAFAEHGSGLFFLRGKPGSGKSTLMKYLVNGRGYKKIQRKLLVWAGQKRLIRVSTLFLLHGTPLQRSVEGFYRTFFFELLCQCPELTDTLFPKNSSRQYFDDSYRSSFRFEILCEAWSIFTSYKTHPMLRVCIFIDGLDELEGRSSDRFKFAQTLNDWAQSEYIKIICSGRPNAEFNRIFNQPHHRIDLQDLTRSDIRSILTDRLMDLRLGVNHITRGNIEELIDDISDQSEGVILWAVLVGKNLEDDIVHQRPFQSLKRTVQMSPSGIEELFRGMWQGVRHDVYHRRMVRAIYDLLVFSADHLSHSWEPRALYLFWLEDVVYDENFPFNKVFEALPAEELASRLDRVSDLLVLYTKHLVEVVREHTTRGNLPTGRHVYETLRFIHRSAREFIESNLDQTGSIPAPNDHTFESYLRLRLSFHLSVGRYNPVESAQSILETAFHFPTNIWRDGKRLPWQVPDRIMERLRELTEAGNDLYAGSNRIVTEENYHLWDRHKVFVHTGRQKWNYAYVESPVSFKFFYLALRNHQEDYVTKMIQNGHVQVDREVINSGLIMCAIGRKPSPGLFKLLIRHRADPDTLVRVYLQRAIRKDGTKRVPLWLLFCFVLVSSVTRSHRGDSAKAQKPSKEHISQGFLILEEFLRLGRGVHIKFDARFILPEAGSLSKNEIYGGFVMDLAQVVRFAKPDNMDRLLLLLKPPEPPPTTYFLLLQRFIDALLQPQFPFRSLPQDAVTKPYSIRSDDDLSDKYWTVRGAFDGKYEMMGDFYYYTI